MRILLDECVPARLKRAFPGHAVRTVTESGWRTSKDRPLLTFAQERFDVFVTVDRQLEIENDLTRFRLGSLSAGSQQSFGWVRANFSGVGSGCQDRSGRGSPAFLQPRVTNLREGCRDRV